MKALVAGWFSYENMGATAGDLLARDLVVDWLREAGRDFDVVAAPPFSDGLTWDQLSPPEYRDVIFVCGPFGNGPPITELLREFAHCRFHGVNLSMLQPLEEWNPFDLLLERDSDTECRPDLTFLSRQRRVPVIGVILVHPQREYGGRGMHAEANEMVHLLLAEREAVRVPIDTRLDQPKNQLRTPAEVESLIARMDAVITTRLHGTVLALKNGVPALPIDPIRGGAKITKQVRALGWPVLFSAGDLRVPEMKASLDYCLSEQARNLAQQCAASAVDRLADTRTRFIRRLSEVA